MLPYFYLLLFFSTTYAILLGLIAYGWHQLPVPKFGETLQARISVLVAARNEATQLPVLIDSFRQQTHPFSDTEVLLIDDHSTDNTQSILPPFLPSHMHLLTLKGDKHGKKQAIALGITQSTGNYIVTTDADCQLPATWLTTLGKYFQKGADMVLAPVRINGPRTFLTAFQGLDVAGTMLLTGAAVQFGSPVLANGANLGFRRDLLAKLGGYASRPERSSGDDVFLLHAAARKGALIAYCKSQDALVDTAAVEDWSALIRQRLRWAGKTDSYQHWGLIGFQGFVFVLSWALLLSLCLYPTQWQWCLLCWSIKIISDIFFLAYACREAGRKHWLFWILPASLLHTIYIAVIGLLALLPLSIKWKGRKVD